MENLTQLEDEHYQLLAKIQGAISLGEQGQEMFRAAQEMFGKNNVYSTWLQYINERVMPFVEGKPKIEEEKIREQFPDDDRLGELVKEAFIVKYEPFKEVRTTGDYRSESIGIIDSITVATGSSTTTYELKINEQVIAGESFTISAGGRQMPITHCSSSRYHWLWVEVEGKRMYLRPSKFEELPADIELGSHRNLIRGLSWESEERFDRYLNRYVWKTNYLVQENNEQFNEKVLRALVRAYPAYLLLDRIREWRRNSKK